MTYAVLRRLAAPLWLGLALAVIACAPLLSLAARLAGRLTGRPEPAALARLAMVYVLGELAVVASPPATHAHRLRQLSGFLDDIVTTAMGTLRVRVELSAEPAAAEALRSHDRPLLVFSRHAGPGDSVLLVHMLLTQFGREPGIVMKEILTLDPVVGLMARELHCALIDGADDDAEEIRDVARELGPAGALLLFPEGGNFTPERRSRAIDWLRRNGQAARADRAEGLEHVVAPRPRGVLAAMEGARGADVIFAAHHGLGDAATGLSLLRELPRDTTVRVHLWHVPAGDLPEGETARTAWLDEWWARLDRWVATRHAGR